MDLIFICKLKFSFEAFTKGSIKISLQKNSQYSFSILLTVSFWFYCFISKQNIFLQESINGMDRPKLNMFHKQVYVLIFEVNDDLEQSK